jgi:glycosyltransferase involved in cell wall biosynthesis
MRRASVGMVINTAGRGGVTEVAYHLLKNLPRREFDLHLCVLKPDQDRHEEMAQRFLGIGVAPAVASPTASKFGMIAGVAAWAADKKLDILHTHSYRPNIYARLGGLMRGAQELRMIPHYHNQYADKWDAEPDLLAIERQLASSSRAMIAVSQSVKEHVSKYLAVPEGRIDVVANGVDTAAMTGADRNRARAALGISPDAFAYGLIGRVCHQKGQDTYVEAAQALATSMPHAVFVMIGDIEDAALHRRLTKRIADAGLSHAIMFAGYRTDMSNVYAALDAVVAPSRWEGFGLMLVEAMAAGKPIVAASVGAIPEVALKGKAALLVPPDDAAALAVAMARLAHDAALRRLLTTAGHERQKKFTWRGSADAVAAVYRLVLGTE